jgi:hypothetical protein
MVLIVTTLSAKEWSAIGIALAVLILTYLLLGALRRHRI